MPHHLNQFSSGPAPSHPVPWIDSRERQYLLPERSEHSAGAGPVFELGSRRRQLLFVTLEIKQVAEQESLNVSIWGSADGVHWNPQPLLRFNQKNYCGVYSERLNFAEHASVRYLRATWEISTWHRSNPDLMFDFLVTLAEPVIRVRRMGGPQHGKRLRPTH